jgi:hypothetical protein
MFRALAGAASVAVGLVSAAPARADDWTLSCSYPAPNMNLRIHYDAGAPSYSIRVFHAGNTGLPEHAELKANIISSRERLTLLTFESAPNARQLLVKVDTAPMTSTAEWGNAVSWDHGTATGTCRQLG